MCRVRYRLRNFLFRRKVVWFSRYSSLCIFSHPKTYQICDVMMGIAAWDKVHFWIYLLNHKSLRHHTWPTDRYKQGQQFLGTFRTMWRTGPKFQALFSLRSCSSYLITNYVKIPLFHFFEKKNKSYLKMVKWPDLAILSF